MNNLHSKYGKLKESNLNKLIKKTLNEKHLMLEYYVCSTGDNHTCGHCGNGSGEGNMSCDDNPSGGGLGVCYWPEGIGEAECCYSDCGDIGPGGGVDDFEGRYRDDSDEVMSPMTAGKTGAEPCEPKCENDCDCGNCGDDGAGACNKTTGCCKGGGSYAAVSDIRLRESQLITENKEKCDGKYVGSNRMGHYYNDAPCEGGEECHRKYPFSNIWGCFDCSGGGRCGYDDYNTRPGDDSTYSDPEEMMVDLNESQLLLEKPCGGRCEGQMQACCATENGQSQGYKVSKTCKATLMGHDCVGDCTIGGAIPQGREGSCGWTRRQDVHLNPSLNESHLNRIVNRVIKESKLLNESAACGSRLYAACGEDGDCSGEMRDFVHEYGGPGTSIDAGSRTFCKCHTGGGNYNNGSEAGCSTAPTGGRDEDRRAPVRKQ